jgi:hypothetical protein
MENYRKITELDKIRYGAYIRWIDMTDKTRTLKKGMFICDIITTEGIVIRGKTYNGKFLNIRMDKCIIFQKLSNEEIMLEHVINSINM